MRFVNCALRECLARWSREFSGDLLILEQILEHLEALVFLVLMEVATDVEDLLFDLGV